MEANNFTDALADTRLAVEKARNQKSLKVSVEVKDTLNRLLEELSKTVECQTAPETTDL
jgi:hypothetical protein